MTEKSKLKELPHAQLVQLIYEALDRLKKANERIESVEKKPLRSGRIKTEVKIAQAKRLEDA